MTMDMPTAIRAVVERRDLSAADMHAVMQAIMTGQATPAQIGGFLVGLRMKGETVDEIAAAAQVMRALATPVHIADTQYLVDTCGTGGDAASTFNISTASAFVVAAAGAKVAKHGNRSVSSKSGSADVLEALGANLELTPDAVARCIETAGVGFMFAPKHHAAMKHAIGPRREMGARTIFNILGPLTNPAGARRQVLGVYARALVRPLAEVLHRLGSEQVLVVHAEEGLDEIGIGGPTHIAELRAGSIREYTVTPEQFNLKRTPLAALAVASATESAERIRAVFANTDGPARDIVTLNAGAAIYAAGLVDDLAAGVARASAVIASGAAAETLAKFIACTRQ